MNKIRNKIRNWLDEVYKDNNIAGNHPLIKIFACLAILIIMSTAMIIGIIISPLLILFELLDVIYMFWWKKAKMEKKYMLKLLNEYCNTCLNKEGLLKFENVEKYSGLNLEELFLHFFTHNVGRCTIRGEGNIYIQCEANKRRSLGDIYCIAKYYVPSTTPLEVFKILVEKLDNKEIGASKCSTIDKYVFHTQNTKYQNGIMEFGDGINFEDLKKTLI